MVVISEPCLVAQALQGRLSPVPSQTKHPGADPECRARGESRGWPDPVPLGGCSTGQTHPTPGTAWGLPFRSCWNAADPTPRCCSCSGVSVTPRRSLMGQASTGLLQGQFLKLSLPWQCRRIRGSFGAGGSFPGAFTSRSPARIQPRGKGMFLLMDLRGRRI